MSKKTGKQPTLKSIEKDCSSIGLEKHDQILIVTSPTPAAMLASAILSRSMIDSGKKFHITFSEPVVPVNKVNELRQKYNSLALLLVGIDTIGAARIKKGSSYPIMIGGTTESEQGEIPSLGTNLTLTAVAYSIASSLGKGSEYDSQLAVGGALLNKDSEKGTKGANNELIEMAKSSKIIQERKGFRLFGVSMLPLDEVFLYSTYPYLKKLSGDRKACDSLLNEAEIPVPKLRMPLTKLTTSEAQRLTSKLVPQLDPSILPQLLGTDFEFLKERESSPFRHLSGLEIMGATAWTINELGAFMSVLLGDRGRALRLLNESHMSHHKDVISAVNRLKAGLMSESTTSATTLKISGYRTDLLPDIGRVFIETGLVDSTRPVVLDHDGVSVVAWPSQNLNMKDVSQRLLREKIDLRITSQQSLEIQNDPQVKEKTLRTIVALNKES